MKEMGCVQREVGKGLMADERERRKHQCLAAGF